MFESEFQIGNSGLNSAADPKPEQNTVYRCSVRSSPLHPNERRRL